jgi:plastocyanin
MPDRRPWIGPGLLAALSWAGPALSGAPVTLSVRDGGGAPVPAAVVYLEGVSRGPTTRPVRVVVDQRDKLFVPQVTVIQTGTEVSFPNSDSVSHHVYSFANPNAFELPLYKGGARPVIQFDNPGVVTLGCNIHDAMIGYIVVVDTPYFASTDSEGAITFGDVAPGSYQVQVWSPRLNPAKPVAAGALTVGSKAVSQPVTLTRRLRPEPGGGGSLVAGDY